MQQGHRWCKGVKVVVSDGSKAYKSAIDAHLGPRPPRAGPLPRHQMVLSGAHRRCAATSSAALKAPSPRSTPKCSGPGSRC